MKFLLTSYAPIIPIEEKFKILYTTQDLTDLVFKNEYLTSSCDPSIAKNLASNLIYRGNVKKEDVT